MIVKGGSDSEMVVMLRPAEAVHIATPLTITRGKIQVKRTWSLPSSTRLNGQSYQSECY